MNIIGYFLVILMGLTLGLIGAGGSILAMPILVYLLKINAISATSYSLFIVGFSALIGAAIYYKKNLVNISSLKIFIPPALISLLFARLIVLPNLPTLIFGIEKEVVIMTIFSFVMIAAAINMINSSKIEELENKENHLLAMIFTSSIGGFIAGMVGAGGGFIIVPTLILFFKLNAKKAIATSLAIIAINSLIGFGGDIASGFLPNWTLLISLSALTAIGMIIGSLAAQNIKTSHLKKSFGFFVLILGFVILFTEILSIFN